MSARRHLALAALLPVLAGCDVPPPESYASTGLSRAEDGRPAGPNARGEPCTSLGASGPALDRPVASAREIFCGGWTQPAARVLTLRGSAARGDVEALAAGGAWRSWIEERFACGTGQPTTLADGTPARLLTCTRRQSGFPHIALVTEGTEGIVLADGLPASLPVIERLARGLPVAAEGGRSARSEALQLAVARMSTEAFGSSIEAYDRAMSYGRELNLVGDFAGAETAFRAALSFQERGLGADNPNTVAAVIHLALNLSNQERFREANALFARAEILGPRAEDRVAPARTIHYRALHDLNQGKLAEAGAGLLRAEAAYTALVPPEAIRGGGLGAGALAGSLNPTAQAAILGLAEARRMRGAVAAREGRGPEARALVAESQVLLRRVTGERGGFTARALRTEARSLSGEAGAEEVGRILVRATGYFRQAAPNERPEAETLLLAGRRWVQAGRFADALREFRAGAAILRARSLSAKPENVVPYLAALDEEARRTPAAAPALRREMFDAAQLAQRGQTVRLANQAAARLGSGGADDRTGGAVRRLQDAERELRELQSARDVAGPAANPTADARLAEARRARDSAEAEAAAAAPGYRQLLLASASTDEVSEVLAPDEALVQVVLSETGGFVMVVRRGGVGAGRVTLREAEVAALVRRVRSGIDSPSPGRSFDTEAAHELYRAVLAPVAPALDGAAKLIIIPDGPLLSIPFGLLLTGPAAPNALRAAPWLIRDRAIVHATSAQTLLTLRRASPASAAPRPYIGFGDFVPPTPAQLARSFPADRCAGDARLATGLTRLPGTLEEVRLAARLSGADPASAILGAEFTAARLRGAGLSDYKVIHLATHALLPGELSCITEPSVIVSPPPGAPDASAAFVRASELLNLRLDADLVILSACNTAGPLAGAGSEGGSGEALSGLARSFFFAGARGLLVTHWPVEDYAAAVTVAEIMRRQALGESTAAAARGAALLLLDTSGSRLPPAYAHPYYWAGFALIGDGRANRTGS